MPRYIAFDTETALTLKGLQAPPLACLSWAEGETYGVVSRHEADKLFESWLVDPNVHLVGHNTAYDVVVLLQHRESQVGIDLRFRQLVFNAYEQGRVHDTMIRERLRQLTFGELDRPRNWYSLGQCAERYLDMQLDKTDDSWRYRYGTLIPVAFSEWPEAALKYAHEDAVATLKLFQFQGVVPDAEAQARAALCFQLMRVWGIRTDPNEVAQLENRLTHAYSELGLELRQWGVLRENGSQNLSLTRELVEQSYPGKAPRTPKGAVKTSNEVVERCSHPALQHLVEFKDTQKVLKTFLPVVKRGLTEPICPYINVLVKNGRSSYRDPNLQQLPRKGGVRECFVARPGKVFVDFDYDTLEIRTLAQVLFTLLGGKTLVEMYQKDPGFDPHTRLASQIMSISYEEGLALKKAGDQRLKDMRQMSKAGNFGFPGGMGPTKFVGYAWKSYQVSLTVDESRQLRRDWMQSIPEMQAYFEMCSKATENNQKAMFTQLFSGRVRGGMSFPDMANGWWSGLAADGAKYALWNLTKACYTLPESPLFGARPVVFVHDQFMLEADEERGHEVGMELQRVATDSMRKFTPEVPSSGASQLMKRWYKSAEPVFENGRLVPYEPGRKAA